MLATTWLGRAVFQAEICFLADYYPIHPFPSAALHIQSLSKGVYVW